MAENKSAYYEVDGRKVTQSEFERFLKSLSDDHKNWSCMEMKDGGITSYEAKGSNGRWYRIRMQSGGQNQQRLPASTTARPPNQTRET